jgi:alpha-galactosidase
MSLWCIARSPLILGANLPDNDAFTLSLLTNDEVIAVDQNSTNNRQLFNKNNQVAWAADIPGSTDKYLAIFNTSPAPTGRRRGRRSATAQAPSVPVTAPVAAGSAATQPADISVSLKDLGLTGACSVRDLWNGKDLGVSADAITATVNSHGAVLYRVSPAK